MSTGDIEDFPGLDPLQTFIVEVEDNGDVYISGNKEQFDRKSKVYMEKIWSFETSFNTNCAICGTFGDM